METVNLEWINKWDSKPKMYEVVLVLMPYKEIGVGIWNGEEFKTTQGEYLNGVSHWSYFNYPSLKNI